MPDIETNGVCMMGLLIRCRSGPADGPHPSNACSLTTRSVSTVSPRKRSVKGCFRPPPCRPGRAPATAAPGPGRDPDRSETIPHGFAPPPAPGTRHPPGPPRSRRLGTGAAENGPRPVLAVPTGVPRMGAGFFPENPAGGSLPPMVAAASAPGRRFAGIWAAGLKPIAGSPSLSQGPLRQRRGAPMTDSQSSTRVERASRMECAGRAALDEPLAPCRRPWRRPVRGPDQTVKRSMKRLTGVAISSASSWHSA
jgi:hypothetical protein